MITEGGAGIARPRPVHAAVAAGLPLPERIEKRRPGAAGQFLPQRHPGSVIFFAMSHQQQGSWLAGRRRRCRAATAGVFTRGARLLLPCLALAWLPPAMAQRCGGPATPIHVIQGRGPASPLLGEVHTVEAVVVARVPTQGRPRGFFVQMEDALADDDPRTSEGLFVFAPGHRPVGIGERVRVTGTVAEHRNRTELTQLRRLLRCGRAPLPDPVPLSLAAETPLEPLEGMRVELAGKATLAAAPGPDSSYLLIAAERLYQPTQLRPPGQTVAPPLLLRVAGRFPAAERPLRAGDRLAGLRGVLDQHDDGYVLRLDAPARLDPANPRPSAPPPPAAGQLRVAGFNLQNYFNGDGRGGGFPAARGAATRAEFHRQRGQLGHVLAALAADVVAVMEVENDGFGPDSAIADLARALSGAAGAAYRPVRLPRQRLGDDAITVGLLYRPDRVRPHGLPAVLETAVDRRYSPRNRPVLAQTFTQRDSNERLTVAVAHFKSKASSCADAGDPDRGDGQGHCNLTRTRAAQALTDWLATDPTGSGDPDVLIMGDLNAYAREDPLRAMAAAGYVDLVGQRLGKRAYTYVFDGRAGYLDYALATDSLASQVTAVRIWHINADEPAVRGWPAPQQPYRSSDHDPVIVDLRLGGR